MRTLMLLVALATFTALVISSPSEELSASGAPYRTFTGHTDTVTSLAFSPDGRVLVTGSWDGTVRIWDVATGRPLRAMRHGPSPTTSVWSTTVVLSPNGQVIASAGQESVVRLWDARTGRQIHALKEPFVDVHVVAFSPDGRTLAGGADGAAVLWDLQTGKPQRVMPERDRDVVSVAFSPDSRTLAGAVWGNPSVKLWEVATGASKREWKSYRERNAAHEAEGDYYKLVVYSPDGQLLVGIIEGCGLTIWEARTGRVRKDDFSVCVDSAAVFLPDGKNLVAAIGLFPPPRVTLNFVDIRTGRDTPFMRLPERVLSVNALALRGKLLVIAAGPDIIVRDLPAH